MIDDSERRAVARNLAREAQAWRETFPDYDFKPGDASEIMQDIFEFVGLHGKVLYCDLFQRLADLVDRPTCKNASGYCDVFQCSACGCKVEITAEVGIEHGGSFHVPFMPSYCPSCGAEVE